MSACFKEADWGGGAPDPPSPKGRTFFFRHFLSCQLQNLCPFETEIVLKVWNFWEDCQASTTSWINPMVPRPLPPPKKIYFFDKLTGQHQVPTPQGPSPKGVNPTRGAARVDRPKRTPPPLPYPPPPRTFPKRTTFNPPRGGGGRLPLSTCPQVPPGGCPTCPPPTAAPPPAEPLRRG